MENIKMSEEDEKFFNNVTSIKTEAMKFEYDNIYKISFSQLSHIDVLKIYQHNAEKRNVTIKEYNDFINKWKIKAIELGILKQ
jgi:hypothetical protein